MAKVNYATVSYVDEKFVELFNMNKATDKKLAEMDKRLKALEGAGTKSGAKNGAKTKPEGKKTTSAEEKSARAKDREFLKQWEYFNDHKTGNVKFDDKSKAGYRRLVAVKGKEGAGTWNVRTAAITLGFKWDKVSAYEITTEAWNAVVARAKELAAKKSEKQSKKDAKKMDAALDAVAM